MKRLRPHLTYANVMVTLLAFVVLGGVAVAAATLPKNSVGTKQLKKNAVTAAKIKAGAVNGAKVKDGSLTGADVVAATLGQVPSAQNATTAQSAVTAQSATSAETAKQAENAARVGNFPPTAFAAAGRFRFEWRTNGPFQIELFALPGGVHVTTRGGADPGFTLNFENTGTDTWRISTPIERGPLAPGGDGIISLGGATSYTGLVMIQNTADPDEAIALQCGLFEEPDRIGCFATLSSELGPG